MALSAKTLKVGDNLTTCTEPPQGRASSLRLLADR